MTTFQVTETGRTWASTSFNRTTRMWRDGGPEYDVEICDDDSGEPLNRLDLEHILGLVDMLTKSERDDAVELIKQVDQEVSRRLDVLGEQVDNWDGADAGELATLLNRIDSICEQANSVFSAVSPFDFEFRAEDYYDVTSLGWHYGNVDNNTNECAYACDKDGTLLVQVSGSTDDGWTTETPGEED